MPDFNVIAEFDSLEQARKAIEALGSATIETENISLLGPAASDAASQASQESTRRADFNILARFTSYVVAGAVAGGALGLILGVPVGLFMLPAIDIEVTPAAVGVAIFLTAFALSAVGGLVGFAMSLQPGEAWALTFYEEPGRRALVGVHSERPEDIELATRVLKDQPHRRLFQVDRNGRRRPIAAA